MPKIVLTILLMITLSACASHYGSARIVSNPPGAEVSNTDDGSLLGVTPVTVWFKDSSAHRQTIALRFKKEGHYEKVHDFWLSMRHKSQKDAQADPQLVEVVLRKIGE